jgi:hypothetical protein
MGQGQVPDVDVVPQTGAVAGGIVRPGDREGVAPTLRRKPQLAQHVGRFPDMDSVPLAVVLARHRHRLLDDRPGCHVNGALQVGVLGDDPGEERAVGNVPAIEDAVPDVRLRAADQRVQDDWDMTGLLQGDRGDRADVPGATCHQDFHAGTVSVRIVRLACEGTRIRLPWSEDYMSS